MIALRSVLFGSLIAMAGAAFAADAVTTTTRDERMAAAQMDFESGKSAMTAPAPKPAHGTSKQHHATTKK